MIFKEKQKECRNLYNGSPIIRQTWYHICVGIDTISGLLRIVDRGVVVIDEKMDMLKNTFSIKPENVGRKLLGSRECIQNFN